MLHSIAAKYYYYYSIYTIIIILILLIIYTISYIGCTSKITSIQCPPVYRDHYCLAAEWSLHADRQYNVHIIMHDVTCIYCSDIIHNIHMHVYTTVTCIYTMVLIEPSGSTKEKLVHMSVEPL